MAPRRSRGKFREMKAKKISATVVTPSQTSTPPPPTNEQVAALAYAIWLDRGQPTGCDLEHWLEAERQLRGGVAPLASDGRVDADTAPAARIEREMDRIVSPPAPRSPTSL
jgi:hypothetical protein